MSVTREKLWNLRTDIDKAMTEIAKRHGLKSLKLGKCVFLPDSFTFKLEGLEEGGLTKETTRYKMEHEYLKLPPLGASFSHAGKSYVIVGLNTTGTKVLATLNGKTYLFRTAYIQGITK
jgi:hypothetical protein